MRSNTQHACDWRESAHRIAVLVVVIGCHASLLLLLSGHVTPWHAEAINSIDRSDSLEIRFIESSVVHSSRRTSKPARAVVKPQRQHRSVPTANTSLTPRQQLVAPATTASPLRPHGVNSVAEPGYVAGGNLLHGADMNPSSRIRVPGSYAVIVPGIHLVDPRRQGLAGAARTLQALLGIPNSHCVKLDALRTLSTSEMLERHISPELLQKTAEDYGCRPKA